MTLTPDTGTQVRGRLQVEEERLARRSEELGDWARCAAATTKRVLAAERALGRTPEEQAHNNPGFDVLSRPAEGAGIRIEVKARIEGSDTFTITRTEVLTALNAAPDHRLALVRVSASGPQHDEVRYISNAFEGVEPAWLTDFDVVSQNLSWNDWWARGGKPF